ncbi:MAG: N-acetylneuraminate lyase [Firmicutes bacterium]|nr:N-acetylneuraminate lyase [Bacillota bacterium]
MKNFKGIFPALLTPFDNQDKINEKALEKLIKMNMEKGVTGFYVGGSTAEAFLLSEDERMYIYKLVKDITKGECTLIAHIGCISTKQSIKFGKYAESLGYDAISSISPFYYKFSFNEIKQHYFDIVDNVNLPMLIYNFPNFSGVTLSVENIGEFLIDPRFIGVKHTSNDYFALEQFKTAFPDKIVYNGFDEMFLAGLSMGADGGIGSTYNFMAEKFIKIKQLYDEGENQEAYKIQQTANKILAALCKVGIMQGEKAVLSLMGYDFGYARAPFSRLTSEQIKFLEKTVLPLL